MKGIDFFFFGTGHFQGTTQLTASSTSAEAPKLLPGHAIHINIPGYIPGHRLCSALGVAVFATGYTKLFWRAKSRGICGKNEPGDHFFRQQTIRAPYRSPFSLVIGAGCNEQPHLAAPGWIQPFQLPLPPRGSILCDPMVIEGSLMKPLLICSRSTLLPQAVLTMS